MIKVAMIGAGSVVFSKNLTGDILSFPEFKNATLSYMDIDADRLEVGANLCRKVGKALGANPTIEATLDRRKALQGADFVINMVQIGGFDSTLVDFEIPRQYGLKFTIADTTGPGGLFRALRTYPMLKGLCADMSEICPRATLLNYSNPMCMNMQTIFRTSSVPAVGLCHSVQGTLDQLMRYINEDPKSIDFICAGINHMAFYLRLMKDGQDLYPRLFAAMRKPEVYSSNKVRFELMKRLGYFVTESSEHNAEYNSFFIPRGEKVINEFDVPIDEYLRRCDGIVDEFERMKIFGKNDEPIEVHRSHEYGSTIIHSIATGTPSVIYGNVVNNGVIENLPKDAIVEVPTLVDRAGLQPTRVGALPPQLTGYMYPHITQHELFIRAAMEGRREHVYQACMYDPLTAAQLSLDQMVEMCDELIAAHGDLLPPLDAKKSLVPTSGKHFPKVDASHLRKTWDARKEVSAKDYLTEWHIIGPFFGPNANTISLDVRTPIDDELTAGSIDLKRPHNSPGQSLTWKKVSADAHRGMVNLAQHLGSADWCIAFAYAEVESIHARDVEIRCGSDDGIRVWINGKLLHSKETGRGYRVDNDRFNAHLNAGVNKILVKIDNYTSGWGFGLAVPKATF